MNINKIIICTLIGFSPLNLMAKDGDPDISEKARMVAASKKLAKKPNQISIYVKGLVCSSCSIGVKVQLRKLDGVDKSQLEKGVKLDVKTQLATLALIPGAKISEAAIKKAIDKAGYEAGGTFRLKGSSVKSIKY